GIDCRLNFLLCDVNVQVESELKCDQRTAERARGGHLVQPGHLAELTLEGRRYRGGDYIRTCSGIKSQDLNRRIVDLRQGRYGKLSISHKARQKDCRHQQRCGNRPQDEWSRRAHSPSPGPPGPEVTCTLLPARSLSTPSTTTGSPSDTPLSIEAVSPSMVPTFTCRTSTVWSGFNAYTNVPCGPR